MITRAIESFNPVQDAGGGGEGGAGGRWGQKALLPLPVFPI